MFFKNVKIHFLGVPPLVHSGRLRDQNSAPFDSGNIHIKESKNPGFTFSIQLKTKFFWSHNLLVWTFIQNTVCFYWICKSRTTTVNYHLLLTHVKLLFFSKNKSGTDLCLIFCMIFEGKYFSCCILSTDQISIFHFLWILRYWTVCVLQLFPSPLMTS